jgi:hypothetical protein
MALRYLGSNELEEAITNEGDRPLKKSSNSGRKRDGNAKVAKARGPVQQDSKAAMAELVAKLSEKLETQPAPVSGEKERQYDGLRPSLDRLTVSVDLEDKKSSYCILSLDGEILLKGSCRRRNRMSQSSSED